MLRHRSGLPLALVATAAAAAAATLLLRPRGGSIEPQAVEASAYFLPQQLERAADFRGTQRLLAFGGMALSGATLALVALRPPRVVRRALDRAGGRPVFGAAAVGAGLSLLVVVVTLPTDLAAHERAVDFGLSTQSLGPWLGDHAKAAAIGALLTGGAATIGLALVRRLPGRWWAPGAAAAVALTAAYVYLAPVLLEPVFNRFEPLPQGKLRSDVLALADRAGVEVGEVYRVDASRRTTGANAYVGGLGSTKRVVLYDNLLDDFPEDEVRSVVAHELAHVKFNDLLRGLAWIALVAPAALLLVQRFAERIEPAARGGREAGPAVLPALALSVALVSFGLTAAGNVLSREVEARADQFALEATNDSAGFISLERRLALRNVSDPDPPPLVHALFGTHPTTLDRIGAGLEYARSGAP